MSAASVTPILGGPLLRAFLLSLRAVFREDVAERLVEILMLLAELPDGRERSMAVAATLGYLESAAGDRVTPEVSEKAVGVVFPREKEKLMATHHAVWLERGREEGRTEGAVATARESVLDALGARFGEVPQAIAEAVRALDALEALRSIHRKAVTIASLDEFRRELERRRP